MIYYNFIIIKIIRQKTVQIESQNHNLILKMEKISKKLVRLREKYDPKEETVPEIIKKLKVQLGDDTMRRETNDVVTLQHLT